MPVVNLCMRGSAVGYQNFSTIDYERGSGALEALDAASGRPLWLHRFRTPDFGCATVSGNVVFTATDAGVVSELSGAAARCCGRRRSRPGSTPALRRRESADRGGRGQAEQLRTPRPVIDAYRLS